MHDSTTLQVVWFLLIGVLWIGYFVLEGFDFGVGMLLRVVGRDEAEHARRDPHHRPRLGRQRGLAARRRRRHVRRVPRVVRDAVLRLLPRAVPDPRRADRPRRRVRVLGQGRPIRLARAWEWAIVVGSALPALLLGRRLGEHRPRRAARRRRRVRRDPLRPAQPVRAARRRHDAGAVPRPRRVVPDAADCVASWSCARGRSRA